MTNRIPNGEIAAMPQISLLRLYLLRAVYLALATLEGAQIWPIIVHHVQNGKVWELMHGVAFCMLGALTAVAVLGIRYPLRMLPLLFFEIAWKVIWLTAVALPLGLAHKLDPDTMQSVIACLMVVVVLFAIPWPYVFAVYVRGRGDRWR